MIEAFHKDIGVRTACNKDCRAIQDLVYGVLAEFDLSFDPNGTDRDIADLESYYFDRGGVFEVLVENDGRIVGTIGLYPLDVETIELRKMYFASAIRGLGLGRKLLKRTIEKLKI